MWWLKQTRLFSTEEPAQDLCTGRERERGTNEKQITKVVQCFNQGFNPFSLSLSALLKMSPHYKCELQVCIVQYKPPIEKMSLSWQLVNFSDWGPCLTMGEEYLTRTSKLPPPETTPPPFAVPPWTHCDARDVDGVQALTPESHGNQDQQRLRSIGIEYIQHITYIHWKKAKKEESKLGVVCKNAFSHSPVQSWATYMLSFCRLMCSLRALWTQAL